MEFTDLLYRETKDIWEKYDRHPFIRGLENGDLDIEKFKFYMIQDYLYLWDYSKLFAIGALKSEDKEMIATFAKTMDLVINGEMDIHRGYMQRLGISEDEIENAEVSLINRSYTNYMLSVSQKGGYEEVVAALLSCAWTYADIAKAIDRRNPKAKEDPFYGEWVQGYLDNAFQETAEFYKSKMNQLGKYLDEKRKAFLLEVFRSCCLYELKFWDMAYDCAMDFKADEALV